MHYSRRLIVQTLVFSRSYLHRQVSQPETIVVKVGTTWARNGRWILPANARLPLNIQGSFTCRKSTTWDKRLYFPSEGRCALDHRSRKTLYVFLYYTWHTPCISSFWLDHPNVRFTNHAAHHCEISQSAANLSFSGASMFLSPLFSNTSSRVLTLMWENKFQINERKQANKDERYQNAGRIRYVLFN